MRYARTAPSVTAAAVTGLALSLSLGGCGSQAYDVAAPPTASVPSDVLGRAPGLIWPTTSARKLAELQDLADRGRRPDLLEPVAVARAYVTSALPAAVAAAARAPGTAVGPFVRSGPATGEVQVTSGGLSTSTVYLRQFSSGQRPPAGTAAERGIWYVQGIGSADLAVLDLDYDGTRLTGALVPAQDGTLTIQVARADGTVVATGEPTAQARHLVPLDVSAPNEAALLVTAVLATVDGTLAPRAFRIGAPDAPAEELGD